MQGKIVHVDALYSDVSVASFFSYTGSWDQIRNAICSAGEFAVGNEFRVIFSFPSRPGALRLFSPRIA
jgi:hypothetical protein